MSVAGALIVNTALANLTGTLGVLAIVERGGTPGFLVLMVIAGLVGLLRDAALDLQRKSDALEQAQEKLVRTQKLAVLAKLTGALQHELHNPVAAIHGNLGSSSRA